MSRTLSLIGMLLTTLCFFSSVFAAASESNVNRKSSLSPVFVTHSTFTTSHTTLHAIPKANASTTTSAHLPRCSWLMKSPFPLCTDFFGVTHGVSSLPAARTTSSGSRVTSNMDLSLFPEPSYKKTSTASHATPHVTSKTNIASITSRSLPRCRLWNAIHRVTCTDANGATYNIFSPTSAPPAPLHPRATIGGKSSSLPRCALLKLGQPPVPCTDFRGKTHHAFSARAAPTATENFEIIDNNGNTLVTEPEPYPTSTTTEHAPATAPAPSNNKASATSPDQIKDALLQHLLALRTSRAKLTKMEKTIHAWDLSTIHLTDATQARIAVDLKLDEFLKRRLLTRIEVQRVLLHYRYSDLEARDEPTAMLEPVANGIAVEEYPFLWNLPPGKHCKWPYVLWCLKVVDDDQPALVARNEPATSDVVGDEDLAKDLATVEAVVGGPAVTTQADLVVREEEECRQVGRDCF